MLNARVAERARGAFRVLGRSRTSARLLGVSSSMMQLDELDPIMARNTRSLLAIPASRFRYSPEHERSSPVIVRRSSRVGPVNARRGMVTEDFQAACCKSSSGFSAASI
jgi:hypothetical protein